MDILKRAAHGILAADGGRSEAELGAQAAEQRRRRLAPTELIAIQALEIFLERQPRAGDVAARRADFRQRFGDGVDRAVERAPRAQFRVVAVAHQGGGRRFARRGNQRGHGLVRAVTVHAAVGREDRARADGAVKPLDKPLLRADVEIGEHRQPRLAHGAILREIRLFRQIRRGLVRRGDFRLGVLGHAVRIQKRAGEIHDRLAAPVHHKARFLGDDGNLRRLQILLVGHLLEALKHIRRDDAGHALLRFGNRQLRAVQPLVFLRHGVQLDHKAGRKLADGDAHAARAEVVAALNHLREFRVAEQPLDAALGRCVALLHLRAAGRERLRVVRLGGARRAAAAVAAGAPAQQHHDIARFGLRAAHVVARGRGDHRAQLHALGDKARMIVFLHLARREADLVAVAGIALRRGRGDAPLGQLARAGAAVRHARVARTGDAHRLIDVAAAGERVADRAAEAGRRAAEALDLRRVVMGLVFEHDEPRLVPAVHVRGDDDGAGVDLVGSVEVVELAHPAQRLCAERRHIHQRDILLARAVNVLARFHIQLVGGLDRRGEPAVVKRDLVDGGEEGRVAAVIRPIGVDGAQLGHARVALFGVAEIIAAEAEILRAHCHAHARHHLAERLVAHLRKAFDNRHVGRHVGLHFQRLRLLHARAARLDRVDDMVRDGLHHFAGHAVALDGVDLRAGHLRLRLLRAEQLQALGGAVRALVILAGQILHREQLSVQLRQGFIIERVGVRLGEDDAARAFKRLVAQPLHVIALENTHMGNRLRAQRLAQLLAELTGGHVITGALFCIDSSDSAHGDCSSLRASLTESSA